MTELPTWSDDQIEFIHRLERLAGYVGREADDEFRDLIAEIQDEFVNIKRRMRVRTRARIRGCWCVRCVRSALTSGGSSRRRRTAATCSPRFG